MRAVSAAGQSPHLWGRCPAGQRGARRNATVPGLAAYTRGIILGSLKIENIRKSFGRVEVLKGIDLEVRDGEFVVFVGPSGCGKSTLLRIIAGLEDTSTGDVLIDGDKVNNLPPAKRGIAMVFQTYALYPHLNVRNNMALGLKQAGTPAAEIDKRIAASSAMLSLEPYLE